MAPLLRSIPQNILYSGVCSNQVNYNIPPYLKSIGNIPLKFAKESWNFAILHNTETFAENPTVIIKVIVVLSCKFPAL